MKKDAIAGPSGQAEICKVERIFFSLANVTCAEGVAFRSKSRDRFVAWPADIPKGIDSYRRDVLTFAATMKCR